MAKLIKANVKNIHRPTLDEGTLRERSKDELEVLTTAYSLQEKGLLNSITLTKGNPDLGHGKAYEVNDGNGRTAAFEVIYDVATTGKPININEFIHNSKTPDSPYVPSKTDQVINGTYQGKKFDGDFECLYEDVIIAREDRLAKQVTANLNNKKTEGKEYIDALVQIKHKNPKMSNAELAKYAGISEQHLKRLLNTLRLNDSSKEMLQDGRLSLKNAQELVRVKAYCDEEDYAKFEAMACKEDYNKFAPAVNEFIENIKAERKANKTDKPQEFQPTPRVKGKSEILNLLNVFLAEYVEKEAQLKDKKDVASVAALAEIKAKKDMLEIICGLDPKSVEAQKAKYDEKIAEKEARSQRSKAAREQEKLAEQMLNAVKAGILTEDAVPAPLKEIYLTLKAKVEEK